ncbi:hypothetical protein Tsubulata_029112, partial [Turnera subulata]
HDRPDVAGFLLANDYPGLRDALGSENARLERLGGIISLTPLAELWCTLPQVKMQMCEKLHFEVSLSLLGTRMRTLEQQERKGSWSTPAGKAAVMNLLREKGLLHLLGRIHCHLMLPANILNLY